MLTILKYVGLALAVAAFSVYGTATVYQGRIAEIELAQKNEALKNANTALTQFRTALDTVHSQAINYGKLQGDLNNKFDNLNKDLKDVQVHFPLPRDCRPDADRLRQLTTAVADANTAARQ